MLWTDPFFADQDLQRKTFERLGRSWGWVLAGGLASILLGIIALSLPVATSLGLTLALGVILVVSGLILLVQAVRLRSEYGSGARFLQAAIALLIGALMLRFPDGGLMGIALALSFYFFLRAAVEWMFSAFFVPGRGRFWGYLGAALSFVLGLFIVFTFPFSALWVPGTLLGVDLIFSGAMTVAIAMALKKAQRATPSEVPQYS